MTDTIACPTCGTPAPVVYRRQCRACGDPDVVATIEALLPKGDGDA